MIFIGIDEAGYGPVLGPLCHGHAAFRVPAHPELHAPDLWSLLHPAVSRDGNCGIAIGDSKELYSTARGTSALESGVRICMECAGLANATAMELSALLPENDLLDLESDPWIDGVSAEKLAFDPNANCAPLHSALNSSSVEILSVGGRAMSARRFNSALTSGANKADLNWQVAAAELKRAAVLARPGEPIVATIDRQGGRKFYSAQVCETFECALAQVEREDDEASVYRLEKNGRQIRIGFYVSGDSLHLPIALASMCAKLTREIIMRRFNAFFQRHKPDLVPTAGYYSDAQRFLTDTAALRRKLAIPDADFIRAR